MANAERLARKPNHFQICDLDIWSPYEPSNISLQPMTSSLPGLIAPSKIWTFVSNAKTWMVRQEYHDAIIAIIDWVSRVNGAERYTVELESIMFTPTETLQQDLNEYPNPFQGHENVGCSVGSIIVTGLPGIGKSVFLKYVWTIRTKLNLPTLFVRSETAYVWVDNQLFELKTKITQAEGIILRNNLPPETWCLVDSNDQLETVPTCISECGRFFIQAASSRDFRLSWRKKVSFPPVFFVMQDWSLSELVCGLQLQSNKLVTSPSLLQEYNDSFGGSARSAYSESRNIPKFRQTLEEAASSIKCDLLIKPLDAVEPLIEDFITIDPQHAHHFLSIFPASDHDRAQFIIRPPSKTVTNIVFENVAKRLGESEVDLFNRLIANNGGTQRA